MSQDPPPLNPEELYQWVSHHFQHWRKLRAILRHVRTHDWPDDPLALPEDQLSYRIEHEVYPKIRQRAYHDAKKALDTLDTLRLERKYEKHGNV